MFGYQFLTVIYDDGCFGATNESNFNSSGVNALLDVPACDFEKISSICFFRVIYNANKNTLKAILRSFI
jgi:hypothetical protein